MEPFVFVPHRYTGACHCGAVRFAVILDLSKGHDVVQLHLVRHGWWGNIAKPAEFEVLSDEQAERCPHCGVLTHRKGHVPELGGDIVSINMRTLEADLDGVDVHHLDGLANTWAHLATTRHVAMRSARAG